MLHFHYCKKYIDSIDINADRLVRKTLENYKGRNSLESSGKISSFTGPISVLLIKRPHTEVILEKRKIDVNNIEETFYFIRGLKSTLSDYVEIRDGKWLGNNPLDKEELDNAIENYKKETKAKKHKGEKPPKELLDWQKDYKLNVIYDIYESERWVDFASDSSLEKGMVFNDTKLYGTALREIFNENSSVTIQLLNESEHLKTYFFIHNDVGVIYSIINITEGQKYLLEGGANTKTQEGFWNKQLQYDFGDFYQKNKINSVASLSAISSKAYPSWVLKELDLWVSIEKNEESGNLSLLPEQTEFLQNFKFPKYINGQAGSGKSTMLYYLFANAYYYKCADVIKGDIIFLTENHRLLKYTQDAVYDLLLKNPEFAITSEDIALVNVSQHFSAFKDFLLSLLPEDDKQFKGEYLDFSKFKLLYDDSNINNSIKKKYSAELSWFVISTYVYGHDLDYKITSENYEEKMPREGKELITLDELKDIETHIIKPFYEKKLKEGYWDKISLIRYLTDKNMVLKTFDVIFCDEAQDFCRVELKFILQLSSYAKYDLFDILNLQFPIVFAGDALQTVNPTGFKTSVLTSMIYSELKDLGYEIKNPKEIDFTPKYNYRSSQTIVNLANSVQYFRKEKLEADVKHFQKSKRSTFLANKHLNVFVSIETLVKDIELQNKLNYKTIILPVNNSFIDNYREENPILKKYDNLISAVDAKGIDFREVAIFGFGKDYDKNWGLYEKRYFFNKLYVAITRAQAELVIIDSEESVDFFWKELINLYLDYDWVKQEYGNLNNFEDIIIFDTNDIIQSSEKVVQRDAERQKVQGEREQNISLLKLASHHFLKLGNHKEYYLCLALIEEIKGNWEKAAEHYLNKAIGEEGLEKAADAYWNGQKWEKLRSLNGSIQNEKSQIRMIISRLIVDKTLSDRDLKIINHNSDKLERILSETSWREEVIESFTDLLKTSIEDEEILIFSEILEKICYDKDTNVWNILGEKYYEIGRYELAIRNFEKVDAKSPSLLYSKLEIAKRKRNNEEEIVIWLGKISLETDDDRFIEILEFDSKDNTTVFSDIYSNVYMYFSYLLKEPASDKTLILAQKTEKLFEDKKHDLAKEINVFIQKFSFNPQIFSFLLERWCKISLLGGSPLNEFNNKYEKLAIQKNIEFIPFTIEEVNKIPIVPNSLNLVPSSFFEEVEIKNFRRLKQVKVSNLGFFNLIVGDNNVGKTTFLEALLFTTDKQDYLKRLAYAHIERVNLHPQHEQSSYSNSNVFYYRLNEEFVYDFQNCNDRDNNIEFTIKNGRNEWSFQITMNHETKTISNNNNQLYFSKNDFSVLDRLLYNDGVKQPYMPYGKGFGEDLAYIYDTEIRAHRRSGREKDFLNNMKLFIPEISQIYTGPDGSIDIRDNNFPEDVPLYQYGEGANKLFRILILLTLHKGKRLLIDEIDAGIHYSKFKLFWKIILKVAFRDKTQIFATTHNEECIQYFYEVLEELEEEYKEVSRIVQMKMVNDKVKIRSFGYETFRDAMEDGIELRAGKTL